MLKHIILLFLRSALLVLLGLILAQPLWIFWGANDQVQKNGAEGLTAVLVIDTSVRMEYQRNNQTRLEIAKESAQEILSRFSLESKVAVLDSTGSHDVFQIDLFAAREQIEKIKTCPERRSLADSISEGIRLLSGVSGRKELYILTDRTKAGWPEESMRRLEKNLRRLQHDSEKIDFYFVDLAVPDAADTGLSGLEISTSLKDGEGEAEISIDLTQDGLAGGGEVECSVESLNDRKFPPKTLSQPFTSEDFKDNHNKKVNFHLDNLEPGFYQGRIQKTPADPLAADDLAYFTLEIHPPKRIILISPEPVEDYTLFMREAIPVEFTERFGASSYFVETVPFDKFGSLSLDDAAVLLFLDTPSLSPADLKRTLSFVRSGGGAGFFLGRNTGNDDFSETPDSLALFGGKPIRQVRVPEGVTLQPDYGSRSGILSGFEEIGNGFFVPWSEIPVFRYWRFEWNKNEVPAVPFSFSDGQPALVQRNLEDGRVLLSLTSFSDLPRDPAAWNRITTGEDSWVFLVLADGMIRFLAGRENQHNLEPYEVSTLSAGTGDSPHLTLRLPDGETLPIHNNLGEKRIRYSGTDLIGSYIILGEDSECIGGFSVNHRAESLRLGLVSFEDLQKFWEPIPLESIFVSEKGGSDFQIHRGKSAADFQSLLALLMGVLLAAEIGAASKFYS